MMKMNYTYNEMKQAFETGRNYQLTGENNFQELIEELNQALSQPPVIKSVCDCGKPISEGYAPCCSLECWHEKFS